ncbi:hypothetical protein ACFLQU_02900 [Verrucomicrobiota bacterium]
MGRIDLNYGICNMEGGYKHLSLSPPEFQRFNPDMLELGDMSKQGTPIDALAAIVDLEGFTAFCNQIDPHLVVPDFLRRLMQWLFGRGFAGSGLKFTVYTLETLSPTPSNQSSRLFSRT